MATKAGAQPVVPKTRAASKAAKAGGRSVDEVSADSKARRYDPAETRARVIEAGFMLFATRGYSGTGTADIAREADVSEGSIFYHFGSKRALMGELGRVHGGRMIAAMQENDPLDQLHPANVVRRCFAFCATDMAWKALKGRVDPATGKECVDDHSNPEAEPFFLASREVVQQWVESHISAYCAAHGIMGIHPGITASMTFALVGDALHRAAHGAPEEHALVREQCARMVAVGCGADYTPL